MKTEKIKYKCIIEYPSDLITLAEGEKGIALVGKHKDLFELEVKDGFLNVKPGVPINWNDASEKEIVKRIIHLRKVGEHYEARRMKKILNQRRYTVQYGEDGGVYLTKTRRGKVIEYEVYDNEGNIALRR